MKARVLLDRDGAAALGAVELLMEQACDLATRPSKAYTQCCAVRAVVLGMRGDVDGAAAALAEAEAEPLAGEEPLSVDFVEWAWEQTGEPKGHS